MLAACFGRLSIAKERLEQSGQDFRAKLTESDVAQLRLARNVFHLSSIVSAVLYYLKFSESKPKFPATISWTIRKGSPKWAQHVIWATGWLLMYRVLHRAGDALVKAFAKQMFATGVICTWFAALDQHPLLDKLHFATAGLYMADHSIFCEVVAMRKPFKLGYYGSFFLMVVGLVSFKTFGIKSEADVPGLLRSLSAKKRRLFWWIELAIMFFENALFTFFLAGLTSGLRPAQAPMTALAPVTALAEDDRQCEDVDAEEPGMAHPTAALQGM